MKRIALSFVIVSFQSAALLGFQSDTVSKFSIDLQYRPRVEYRNGYRDLPIDSLGPAYFGTHRFRLGVTYNTSDIILRLSVQDVRLWGAYGTLSSNGSLSVYEAYADMKPSDDIRFRIGRQGVELDNGRLFSASNWNQRGRAHDGLSLSYSGGSGLSSSLMSFFNQIEEHLFGTSYNSQGSSNYKWLGIHTLLVRPSTHFQLYVQNSGDGHQSPTNEHVLYVRGTSGGRVTYSSSNMSGTLSSYYQFGHLPDGRSISAYYFQPEISYSTASLTVRLGAEYMSGDNALEKAKESKSFIPLYGVVWKFMGNMDYFISFPGDVGGGGLVNPYLSVLYNVNKRLMIRSDWHIFQLQNAVLDEQGKLLPQYLGAELDLSATYRHSSFCVINGGVSVMRPSNSLEYMRKSKTDRMPLWCYVMITISPTVFEHARVE